MKPDTHYLFIGQHRAMLEWARENRVRMRDITHGSTAGARGIRGRRGPIQVIMDVPAEHLPSPREDMALFAAATINRVHGWDVEPQSIYRVNGYGR